jgi:transposase-like protein
MVDKVAAQAKSTIEVAEQLKPQWSGWLFADGKTIRVKGEKYCLLIGVDLTRDIVHGLLAEGEFRSGWKQFFQELKEKIGYPLRGLTSDMDEDLEWGFRQVYEREPHQYCVKHMAQEIDKQTDYAAIKKKLKKLREQLDELTILASQKGKAWAQQRQKKIERIQQDLKKMAKDHKQELELRDLAQAFIYAKNKKEALKAFKKMMKKQRCFKKEGLGRLIQTLKKRKEGFLARFDHPQMHRTNNIAENTIRQIERRLKTIEGFQGSGTAGRYLNLLITYLPFKPFTDCRKKNKHQNGKSRLQLAGVDTKGLDWVKFSQKNGVKIATDN